MVISLSSLFFKVRQFFLQDDYCQLKSADFLIIRHDNNCGYEYNGKYYSQILDSVIDLGKSIGLSFTTVAKPFSKYGKNSAYNNPILFNRSFFFAFSVGKISSLFIGGDASLRVRFFYEKKIWLKILKLTNPKAVIAIQPSPALCSAGKKLGVRVYDYQHGIISDDHLWYGKSLKKIEDDTHLPSGILLWDTRSKDVLYNFGKARNVELHVLGNPWCDRFFAQDKVDELVSSCIEQGNVKPSFKPSILVSLQWGLKHFYYEGVEFNGLMCNKLVNVIRNTESQYSWKLRLHPVQIHLDNKKKSVSLLETLFGDCSDVEWEKSTKLPLPVLLNNINLHITDMSTVVVEAAWFGIPSAILNPYVREGERLENTFLEQRESGIATVLNQDESEIIDWIKANLHSKRERLIEKKTDSLEKFLVSFKDENGKC